MFETYKHRLGKFSLPQNSITGWNDSLSMLPIFARVVVVDCRQNFATETFDYMGLSPDFDEIPMGSPAPEYVWEITTGAGEISVKAVRVEG